jgi:hypothetical protein
MIMERVERPVITSINLKSNQYRIDVSGLPQVLAILRKGMYSTPKRIIVQEYANNARDAHVAVGTPDRPIKIYCPDHANPYLKIQDFGPGLSPDDIQAVFIQYGASTKRHTNEQIGSFGLGSKSAFAYTDSFEVETINNGIKYNYAAYIDATEIGEMPLLSAVETDEPSGTTITIPIQTDDIYDVNKWIAKVTEYWTVRPEVVGHVAWSNRKIYFHSENWALAQTSNDWQAEKMLFCVAGIPYYFNLTSQHVPDDLLKFSKCPFIVHLKTGEVTINANRESLVEDEKTIATIRRNLEAIQAEFKNHVVESFQKCEKLNEVFKLRKSFEVMGVRDMIGVIDWKGLKIESNSLRIPPEIGEVYYCSFSSRGSGKGVKLGSAQRDIDFNKESGNYIFLSHETKYETVRKLRVRNAMLKNNVRCCQVVWFRNPIDISTLEPHGFSYFDWEDLSNFENKNFDKVNNVGVRSETTYVYHCDSYGSFEKTSQDPDELNDGYYVELDRGSSIYHDYQLKNIQKYYNIKIWGIPKRFMKYAHENEDISPLEDFLKIAYEDTKNYLTKNMNNVAIHCLSELDAYSTYSRIGCDAIANRLVQNDHPFKKWVNACTRNMTTGQISDLLEVYKRHNIISNMLRVPEFQISQDLVEIRDECLKKYPMLEIINEGMGQCDNLSPAAMKEIQDSIVDYLLFAGKPVEVTSEYLQPF